MAGGATQAVLLRPKCNEDSRPSEGWKLRLPAICLFALIQFAGCFRALAQEAPVRFAPLSLSESSALAELDTRALLPDSDQAQSPAASQKSSSAQNETTASQTLKPQEVQPKRILGVMPNFRAVSAASVPPPPTPKQAFIIAAQNSFDYSAFIFVGITSLLAEGTDAHPQLGEGIRGFGQYYWRGFVDKTDGNYWVIFILPTIFHQDERYYAMGKGGIIKRLFYAASRVVLTPNYQGHVGFNTSELLGRGISQGISLAYYPSETRTPSAFASKYGYAIGRDALTNMFREVWPDIATHVLHRHP